MSRNELVKKTGSIGVENVIQLVLEFIIAELGLFLFAIDLIRGVLIVFGYFFGAIIRLLPQWVLDLSNIDEALLAIEKFLHYLADRMPHTIICKSFLNMSDEQCRVFWLLWCVSSIFKASMIHWAVALYMAHRNANKREIEAKAKRAKKRKKRKKRKIKQKLTLKARRKK